MQAVNALFDLQIGGREIAILCQRVENLIVGAPCGIMDQMTVACGTQDTLLALLCQPAELQKNKDIARLYSQETGLPVEVIHGSSPGAIAYVVSFLS